MKILIKFSFCIILTTLLTSCNKKMKCDSPPCGDGNSITYRIGDQSPNQSSYSIDCEKEVFQICFCARIPSDLTGIPWIINVLQGNTQIASKTVIDVGSTLQDNIEVNVDTYANVQDNFRIQIFSDTNNAGMNYSNTFTWSCQ